MPKFWSSDVLTGNPTVRTKEGVLELFWSSDVLTGISHGVASVIDLIDGRG